MKACKYCGEKPHQICPRKIQNDIMFVFNRFEKHIAKPDKVDHTGIIMRHMRASWGFRDFINNYLKKIK